MRKMVSWDTSSILSKISKIMSKQISCFLIDIDLYILFDFLLKLCFIDNSVLMFVQGWYSTIGWEGLF